MNGPAPWRSKMGRSIWGRFAWSIFAGCAALALGASALGYATPRLKPPAPGPQYMSREDHALMEDIASALKRKRFAQAKTLSSKLSDPVAASLAAWMYFMAEDPAVDLIEAGAFLDAHNDWPQIERIQTHVEKRIPRAAPADDVLAFFETRNPVSGEGKIALARALFAKNESAAAEFHLRDAWIHHNFTVAEERRILQDYGEVLRQDDHAARVDRLLWARQVTNARRTMSKLKGEARKMAVARAALLMRAASGPRLFGALSADQQHDPGVLHAAVRYFRRTHDEPFAIELSRRAPDDPEGLGNPERWWDERQLLMRWALKEGRFADAYVLAAHNGLGEGSDLAEAEFNAGWIALRFLGQPERAEAHFLALASTVGTPISLSRAYYWAGRAAAAQGKTALARSYYDQAAQYYYSFYGQLAAEELGGEALTPRFGPLHQPSRYDQTLFASRSAVAALRMLADLDLAYEFMVFAYHVDDQLERPGEYMELAKLARGERAPHLSVRAGKVAIQRDAFAPDVAYPLIFVPEQAQRFVAPEIILGLSRQESEFNPRAFSRAGARGVMQLIPSTALITARKEGIRYSRPDLLNDPDYNITLGSAHLSHLLDRFDGSLIMTLAGYNAGAARVSQWIEVYGDPRKDGVNPVDWIELVPFSETRNYIQRVLENVQVYRGRLNNGPIPGKLASDLERGGDPRRVANIATASRRIARRAERHGAQSLAPMPARTAARVAHFKIAMAEAAAAEEAATTDDSDERPALETVNRSLRRRSLADPRARMRRSRVGKLPRIRKTKPDEAPATSNPILNEEPAPEKIENTGETEDEERAVDPAPISMTPGGSAPSPLSMDANSNRFDPNRDRAPPARGFVPTTPSQSARRLEPAPPEEGLQGNQERFVELDDPDNVDDVDDLDDERCVTYREYLAEIEDTEVAANDPRIAELLSELGDDGLICR